MMKNVWGKGLFGCEKPQNDNRGQQAAYSYLDAKALYDEAHEHLMRYEALYAQAHAIDMACRLQMTNGGRQ